MKQNGHFFKSLIVVLALVVSTMGFGGVQADAATEVATNNIYRYNFSHTWYYKWSDSSIYSYQSDISQPKLAYVDYSSDLVTKAKNKGLDIYVARSADDYYIPHDVDGLAYTYANWPSLYKSISYSPFFVIDDSDKYFYNDFERYGGYMDSSIEYEIMLFDVNNVTPIKSTTKWDEVSLEDVFILSPTQSKTVTYNGSDDMKTGLNVKSELAMTSPSTQFYMIACHPEGEKTADHITTYPFIYKSQLENHALGFIYEDGNTYDISYNLDGGKWDNDNEGHLDNTYTSTKLNKITSQSIPYKDKYAGDLRIPKKEGFFFAGWECNPSDYIENYYYENYDINGNTFFSPKVYGTSITSKATGNISLTAIWEKVEEYKINYDLNGGKCAYYEEDGSFPDDLKTYIYGGPHWMLPSAYEMERPGKPGYRFKGWKADREGLLYDVEGGRYDENDNPIWEGIEQVIIPRAKGDITLTAIWEPIPGYVQKPENSQGNQPENTPDNNLNNKSENVQVPVTAKNKKVSSGDVTKVNTSKDGTATITGVKKNAKKVTVSTVDVNGVKYAVTAIAKNAFKDTKATEVTLKYSKKNITIKKDAFKKSKVKTLSLNSFTKASQIKMDKNALKSSKISTIKVSKKIYNDKKQKAALIKTLKKAGLKKYKLKKI